MLIRQLKAEVTDMTSDNGVYLKIKIPSDQLLVN
jgi:hypothetical protein